MKSTRDIILQTGDLDAATTFYEGVMGLHAFAKSPALKGFETGSFRLFVERGAAPGPVFEFLVDDLHAARARLLAAGCVVVDEDPAVPRCYLRDPFGLTFNIAQRA